MKNLADMNVLITLPKHLIDAIVSGKKTFEMRSVKPHMMKCNEDGFFCVEKGTDNVRCWCQCDYTMKLDADEVCPSCWTDRLMVDAEYLAKYCVNKRTVYMWHIAEVVEFEGGGIKRDELYVDRNPQLFAYCPLSFGRSY